MQAAMPAWCQSLPKPEYRNLKQVPTGDTWFQVYRVTPDVFAIYEPRQAEQTISYFIVGSHRALLFDSGMGIGNIRKVTSALSALPVVVLNSHTHHDHVGGNWQFDTVYGMDTPFTRHNAQGGKGEAQREIAVGEICGDLPAAFDRQAYETKPWKIAAYTHDGDKFDLGGRVLEVRATPGHTPDSISLFDRQHGLLFTGDTFYAGTIWLYRPETNLDAYAASTQRLAALEPQVKLVLGAHNVPGSPPEVLLQLVDAFEAVRSGKVAALPAKSAGQVRYKSGSISFLMSEDK